MRKKESLFKDAVKRDLKKTFGRRCKELKTQERARRGVPDLILCLSGKYVAVELKNEGEPLEPIQQVFLDDVIAAGGLGFRTSPDIWEQHLKMLVDFVGR